MPKIQKVQKVTVVERRREFLKRETAILKMKYSFLTPAQINGKAQELWRKFNLSYILLFKVINLLNRYGESLIYHI